MRLKLISCEVFSRELAAASASSPNHIELEFLSGGGKKRCTDLRGRLQRSIDKVDRSKYQAVLLGYGLCNHQLAGLRAGAVPLVIPRALDCVSRLLREPDFGPGSTGNKAVHFDSGNRARAGSNAAPVKCRPVRKSPKALKCGIDQLAARFGPEVAQFLFEEFATARWFQRGGLFFNPACGESSLGLRSRQLYGRPGLGRFGHAGGPCCHFQQLVDGYWSYDHFLVVPPGWRVSVSLDRGITAEQSSK